MKKINTTIRISIDNKNWSDKMSLDTFIKRHKNNTSILSVEISEVITLEQAKDLILDGLTKLKE